MAIILDSISIIQLMRAFNQTGPLIQTIIHIIWDIRGFWLVCGTILLGFTCAFIVVMPNSEAFSLFEPRMGPIFPVITMLQAMVGAFDIDDYKNTMAMVMFVAFIFIFAIVMLNLLIVIIGMRCPTTRSTAPLPLLEYGQPRLSTNSVWRGCARAGEAYNKIMKDEQLATLSLRADVIVEWEKANPQWHTQNQTVHDKDLPPGRCKCKRLLATYLCFLLFLSFICVGCVSCVASWLWQLHLSSIYASSRAVHS